MLVTNVTQFMLLLVKDFRQPPMKRLREVVISDWEQKATTDDQGYAPVGSGREDRDCGRRGLRLWPTMAAAAIAYKRS
ncbi:hypothetical protein BHM03_00042942 [Ensete ventricosum]|nr:hypothetical protein BHM03_00042942 [Ensete ventricosum]